MITPLYLEALVPIGKIFLMAGFTICLVRAMHGTLDLDDCFERLLIGFLGLEFFMQLALGLDSISNELASFIHHLGDSDDLKMIVLDAFREANRTDFRSSGINVPSLLEQAWRTGVWGIMTMIVDYAFLIASFLLECAHHVLWKLMLFLVPLAAGLFPLFPRVLGNLVLYAVELALWMPLLGLVEITTGIVARQQVGKAGSWGLYVIACELLAILLMLMIPSITHRFLQGAFSGDLDTSHTVFRWARGAALAARGFL